VCSAQFFRVYQKGWQKVLAAIQCNHPAIHTARKRPALKTRIHVNALTLELLSAHAAQQTERIARLHRAESKSGTGQIPSTKQTQSTARGIHRRTASQGAGSAQALSLHTQPSNNTGGGAPEN